MIHSQQHRPASPRRASCATLVFATLVLAASGSSQAFAGDADWPQFRGSQASGIGPGAPTLTSWDIAKGEGIRWKTAIPGLAHSAPILWGDRIYVTTATRPGKADLKVGLYGDIESASDTNSHQWRLISLDAATGKVLYDVVGHESVPKVKRHPKASHCNSTPATDGRRIVAIFGSEGLFCFAMDGKALWKTDLGPMDSGYFAVPSAQWGFASSPVIADGKVIVLCDVQTNSFLAAFSLETGKELWRTSRSDVPTWGTPTVVAAPQAPQVLVNGWHRTAGYDLATGREAWFLDGGGDIPVPTPITGHGLAYFTSAHGKFRPMIAVSLAAKGNITPPEVGTTNEFIRWAHPRKGNYMQTPILVGDLLYACVDTGVVTCFDAKTGEVKFSERIGGGTQGFTASPVSDGRHVYFPSEVGNVFVMPATGKFSVVSTNSMGEDESVMAAPCISNGSLYIRSRSQLVAIGQAGPR